MAAAIALAGILAVAAVLRMSDAPAADVRASVSAGNEEAVTGLTRPIADPSPERR
jgi:hypothetical protein